MNLSKDEQIAALKANGIDSSSVEQTLNQCGIKNKNFEIGKGLFDDIAIVSNDTIPYCEYMVDSHIRILYEFISRTLVSV